MFLRHLLSICFIILAPAVFTQSPQEAYDEIQYLYENFGESDYIGEDISQMHHALLTAFVAKQEVSSDHEMIIAALLHDIGHLITLKHSGSIDAFGAKDHEKLGSEFLKSLGFSDRITDVIEGHVNAKRYLCFKNPNYLSKLSHGSLESLKTQGWIMSQEEALNFEKTPYLQDILTLRSFEERGKDPHGEMIPFAAYKDLILEHLSKKCRTERDSNP